MPINNHFYIVKSNVAPLYSLPKFQSEMITQALMYESLECIEKKNNWYKVKQWDGYIGWVHFFYLSISPIHNLHITKEGWKKVHSFRINQNIKVNCSNTSILTFGTLIPFEYNKNKDKYTVSCFPQIPDLLDQISIDKKYLMPKKVSLANVLDYLPQLLGIPYIWGGKSAFGYDCSGLVQTILIILGIKFPRDTGEQIKSTLISEINNSEASAGDLIFFKKNNRISHVGFFKNKEEFYHSQGYVKINSILSNNKYYDNELAKMNYSVYKLKIPLQ